MPLWTDAYIGDTQHLTNEEHGVYLRLLMFAWRSPDCSLPNDDKRLAIMVGVTGGKWAKLKPIVMAFWTLDGNVWRQKKLTKERAYAEKTRKQKVVAGKASAEAKALKSKEVPSTAVPTAETTAEQLPIPIPIPPTEEGKPSSSSKRKTRIPEDAVISDGQVKAATKRGHSLQEAEAQFAKFKNDALAKGKLFLNWDRAFVNWLDSEFFRPLVDGVSHDNRNRNSKPSQRPENRADPALEQIARLAGIGGTPGNGSC
jgi:uncharacterized protein YdaU (DUF1376 family)